MGHGQVDHLVAGGGEVCFHIQLYIAQFAESYKQNGGEIKINKKTEY